MNDEMNNNPPQLKDGWKWTKLGTICKINPKLDQINLAESLKVSFIPMKAVEELSGKIDLNETRELIKVKKGYTYFGEEDIIFAKITPCMENGKVAITKNLKNGIGFGSTEFHVLRASKDILNIFLFYYLIQKSFRKLAQRQMTGTAGQLRVPKGFLENFSIPLPPLPEQQKIVEKIEELFSELDNAIENLKKAEEQIKTYRQSVLKYAFEGKLLDENTQINGDDKNGKLPDGWRWKELRDIGEIVTGTTPSKKHPEYYGEGYPLFKPTELNAGKNVRIASDNLTKAGIQKARLLPIGSILVTCIGATIGKTGLTQNEGATNQQINSIIPHSQYSSDFIYYFCISKHFQDQILNNASSTTLPILNKTKFQQLIIPSTNFKEQTQIVEEIERRFSVADKTESAIDEALQKAEALKQSILKQAFEGKLV